MFEVSIGRAFGLNRNELLRVLHTLLSALPVGRENTF